MLNIFDCVMPSPHQIIFVCNAMRNPMNSWDSMDSYIDDNGSFVLGPNDSSLMKRLAKSGPNDRKFMRQIPIMVNINAPIYW